MAGGEKACLTSARSMIGDVARPDADAGFKIEFDRLGTGAAGD